MADPISQVIFSESFTSLLVTLVIPFVLIFTILTIGFRMTRIFGSGNFIYILLGLGITILIYVYNPGNVFTFLVGYLTNIGISVSIIILLGAVVILSWRVIGWLFNIGKSSEHKIKDLNKNAERLLKEFYRTRDVGKRMALSEQLKKTEEEIKFLYIKEKKVPQT